MSLSELIKPDAVLPALRVNGKKQALQEMSERAAPVSGLPAREIFDALLQRERLGSTGVGDGVAIPHGKLAKCERIFGVFARLERADRLRGARRASGRPDLHADRPGIRRRRPPEGAGDDRAPAAQHARSPRNCARPATRPRSTRSSPWRRRRTPPDQPENDPRESARHRHAEKRSARSAGQGDRGRAAVAGDRRRAVGAAGQGVRYRARRRRIARPRAGRSSEACERLLANTIVENYAIEIA